MEILIIRFSALGDLVTLEPTFRALRHFHRDDHITFLTSQVGKELYEDTGYFDRIVVEQGTSRGRLLQRSLRLRRELGPQRFGIIFNLQSSSLSHLLTLMLRKRRVVNISAAFWQKLLSRKIPYRRVPELLCAAGFPEHQISAYIRNVSNNQIALGVSAHLAARYRRQLTKAYDARLVIALAPGASPRWESKKWGDERFAELASKLQATGFAVIVVGSNLETDAARLIHSHSDQAMDFTGRTTVTELKALLSNASVLVGNDSGPAHLAAAVGIPTVTIFAPTGSVHCVSNMSYRGTHVCLTPEAGACHTCYNPVCKLSRACMASISVEKVFHAILELANLRKPSQ